MTTKKQKVGRWERANKKSLLEFREVIKDGQVWVEYRPTKLGQKHRQQLDEEE